MTQQAVLLLCATLVAAAGRREALFVVYGVIVLTALAMGVRNATVRKIALPDLTTTVLTLTRTGLAPHVSPAFPSPHRART